MKRVLLLSGIIYTLVLVAFATRNGILLVLVLPFVIYLGAGLLFGPEEMKLVATRKITPHRVPPGYPVKVEIEIVNEGDRLESIVLEDQLPPGLEVIHGEISLLASLDSGESVEISYTVSASRGDYRFGNVCGSASDLLGIYSKEISIPAVGRLSVHPEMIRIGRIPIRPRGTRVFSGFIPARQGGPGVEFFGVREYQHGDPLRWINWRASARNLRGLFINQFEQERCADVSIILDTRHSSEIQSKTGDSLFEYSVSAASALAETFLKDGNRVGLLMFGTQLDWTIPGYGKQQREKILQSLARAKPGRSLIFEKLENIPVRLLPAHSQLVLISPLHRDDLSTLINLRARGYGLLVISPDPIEFEMKQLNKIDDSLILASRLARLERNLTILKLRQAGIQILNWDVDASLEGAMNMALSRVIPQIHAAGVRA